MEDKLKKFLEELSDNVFIKSTNSMNGKEEELNPIIEDREGTILISGEWDREDLKGILKKLINQ